MIIRYVLIIGIICLNINAVSSQERKQYSDKYLIVLDVQHQFYENSPMDSSAKELVRSINSLIDKFDPEKVIYVKATGKTLSFSSKGFFVDTLPVPSLDSNLKIVSNNIFIKVNGDAFTCMELNNFLRKNNASEIILVGLLAEKCIYKTAIGGIDTGYDIYIIPDAIMGKTTKRKGKAIRKMTERGVVILPFDEL